MKFLAFFARIAFFSVAFGSAQAALIDNGDFTSDDVNGFDWLDFTVTQGQTFNQVSTRLGTDLAGWRYATRAEVSTLWQSAGGDPAFFNGISAANDGVVVDILALLGDCGIFAGVCFGMTAEPSTGSLDRNVAILQDVVANLPGTDNMHLAGTEVFDFALPGPLPAGGVASQNTTEYASYLVRDNGLTPTLPESPVVLLFGAGLVGLGAFRRVRRGGLRA